MKRKLLWFAGALIAGYLVWAVFAVVVGLYEDNARDRRLQAERDALIPLASCMSGNASKEAKRAIAFAFWGPLGEQLGLNRDTPMEIRGKAFAALTVLAERCGEGNKMDNELKRLAYRMSEIDNELGEWERVARAARQEQMEAEAKIEDETTRKAVAKRATENDWALRH